MLCYDIDVDEQHPLDRQEPPSLNLAILPARGGSKRIKNKNIVDFLGRPIIAYPLEALKKTGLFSHIHVSTDDLEIKRTVEGLGFPVDFMRPKELASDTATLTSALRWTIDQFVAAGKDFEVVCVMMPCSPTIQAGDIVEAYEIFRASEFGKPLCAVTAFPVPIEWAFTRLDDGSLEPVHPGAASLRSQDLQVRYYDTGTFYFYTPDHIRSGPLVSSLKFISYLLPRHKAVDIDEPADLDYAKILFRSLSRDR